MRVRVIRRVSNVLVAPDVILLSRFREKIFFFTGEVSFHFTFYTSSVIILWEEKAECLLPPKVRLPNREYHGLWSIAELHRRLTNCRGSDEIRSAVGAPNYYLRGSRAAVRPRHNGEIPGRRGASDGILIGSERERKRKTERKRKIDVCLRSRRGRRRA